MREEFKKIYTELYEEYVNQGSYNPREHKLTWHTTLLYEEYVKQVLHNSHEYKLMWHTTLAIEKNSSKLDLDQSLREDAKLFLLVNFHQMVLKPVLNSNSHNHNMEDLMRSLNDDIYLILQTCRENMNTHNKSYISAHMILSAIDQRWEDIKTLIKDLWGEINE